MAENTDVVVIGGGYAGVMAANRLTQRDDVTVTLINPRPAFVERIRLHQLVGGSHDAVVDYAEILAGGVRLVVDTVTRIDPAERSVTLATSGTVGYDYLRPPARARPRGRPGKRWRRRQAGRAAADHRRRKGGPLPHRRHRQGRRHAQR
ncbi:FAD-dependent oxidoreductase [Allorhizocola rhizosphaerae]|uniref:FAD-dependent oxidoreductase n=1 Tax=Allorhizocola rhizosphaerae TaxID=1872709 RepID=UPI001FE70AAD|nr:FAD-dependent oxidoreductase [Allorhizocola rhizosphaerae]